MERAAGVAATALARCGNAKTPPSAPLRLRRRGQDAVLHRRRRHPRHELWKSDGTAAGTVLVKDINPGAGS